MSSIFNSYSKDPLGLMNIEESFLFLISNILLVYNNCRKGFHCAISKHAYNVLDHIHPSITSYPSLSFSHNF
jgi:hypothetical protein